VPTNLLNRITRPNVYASYAEEAAHPEVLGLLPLKELCTFFPDHAEMASSLD
jgi:hypothetical protein